ncbi:MAG: phage scaffolding protein [Bacteroidota bacterium]|nr:phage scaffolding protein [Bacteroidota bacterium]
MNKDELLKLGLTEDQANKVLEANTEQLKGFIPKARFDEVNNSKKQLEKDLNDRDTQLETLKNSSGDVETLKKTIETLQADNKETTEKYNAELANLKLNNAVETALLSANAVNVKAVKALLNMDSIKLDGETLLGINEQIESLKKAEDSKMLFKSEQQNGFSGVKPGEGNTGETGAKPKTLAESIAAALSGNNQNE